MSRPDNDIKSETPALSISPDFSIRLDNNKKQKEGPPKLSLLIKCADGSGHVLNDLCASLWFSYLLLYLQNVVKLSSDYAAGLLLLGQVVYSTLILILILTAYSFCSNVFFV